MIVYSDALVGTNVKDNYSVKFPRLVQRINYVGAHGGRFSLQLHGIHECNISDGFATANKIAKRLAKTCGRNVTLRYTGLGEWLVGVSAPSDEGNRFGLSLQPYDVIYNDLGRKCRVGRNTSFGTELLPG